MNARLLVAVALVLCAVAVRGEDVEESALASVETVEPTFLEADAEADVSPLFQLPKKMAKRTVEPRYYGESQVKPKKYISPEYRDPKPVTRKQRKNAPVLFTSHYFSPLPKKLNGKKLRVSRQKRGRLLVPFRATVETPAGHRQHKGFREAELWDGRLPNKYDDPRQNMKKTKAPAPQLSLLEAMAAAQDGLEADTTDEAEAEVEGPVPPPFQHDEGEQQATVVESTEQFFDGNFQPPTWADEEATESELSALEAGAHVELTAAEKAAQQATKQHLMAFATSGVAVDKSKLPRLVPVAPHVSAEDAVEQYNDLDAFLQQAEAASSFVEVAEETEDEDEEEAEDETESEDEDEAEDESEDEAEDEAEEEEADEAAEFALVETSGSADDSVDAEMDEMAQNEAAASVVDMDATSDEAAMTEADEVEETETVEEEVDSDEQSSAEEADSAEEEVTEDEAVDEAEVADAVALVEESADADSEVDTLLAEVDSHMTSVADADAEAENVVEAEAAGEQQKGTPGASIAAGMTWEDAQTERLNAMEAQLQAEKAAAPKVAAQVVASRAELSAVDSDHQTPQYNSVEAEVQTVEPELMVETAAVPSAQAVLKSKIAQLKAINRA